MRKISAQFAPYAHTMAHRVLFKTDYAVKQARWAARSALPLCAACVLALAVFRPDTTRALLKWVFAFSLLGVWSAAFIKRPAHGLWISTPLRAARHATRLVWGGALGAFTSVLVMWAGLTAYRAILGKASAPLDALMACGALLAGQALFGLQMLRTVRGRFFQYAGALINVLIFLGLFAL